MNGMIRLAILVALASSASAGIAGPEQNVLDRTVSQFSAAGIEVTKAVMKLATREGFCVGIESAVPADNRQIIGQPKVSLTVSAKTVGEILDALVAQDPRYTYRAHGNWVNLLPRSRAEDVGYPLNWTIPGEVVLSSENHGVSLKVNQWLAEKKVSFVLLHIGTLPAKRLPVSPQTGTLTNPTLREAINVRRTVVGINIWSISAPMVSAKGEISFIMSHGVLPSKEAVDRNQAAAAEAKKKSD